LDLIVTMSMYDSVLAGDEGLLSPLEDLEIDISFDSAGTSTPSHSPNEPRAPKNVDQRRMRSLFRKADLELEEREISDNVHGLIKVPPVCMAIIDTTEFDRLRGLRQLGNTHYVYPNAKHSRWEHSLGVMHLAGKMIEHLMKVKPGCATETDKICVMLAGLCHDLGHGPFSHLWESFVRESRSGYEWCHEKTSIDLLDYIIEENDLMPTFESHGLTRNDITFVKELIYGPLKEDNGDYPYVGRGPEKFFLYEIVANKISSVDVDKFDYMLRDNKAMDLGLTFKYDRFMSNIDLTEVDGKLRMSIRDKEAQSVKSMFLDRARFHRDGYQHKTVLIIDRMILDVLLAADEHLRIETDSGGSFKLSEACDNIEAFCKLTDEYLIRTIQNSTAAALQTSKDILKRIVRRQLYKQIGYIDFNGAAHISLDVARQSLRTLAADPKFGMDPDDLVVLRKRINMGMGNKNPIEKILLFDKKGRPQVLNCEELRRDMPREMSSETYFVLVKKIDEDSFDKAKEISTSWLNANGLQDSDLNLSIKLK